MTVDFPAPDPVEDEDEGLPWEKAFAQNGFAPELFDDRAGMCVTMLHDHLQAMADERYGAGRWVERGAPVIEEIEVVEWARHGEYEATDDDDNPILDADGNPVMVAYYDNFRYFRMLSWFRAKGEGE